MVALYALTLFLSAALLFAAEPMMGKLILPLLGGTPAVWNTCVMFFQLELLAGYLYAHLAATRLRFGTQAAVQLGLLAAGLLTLPLAVPAVPPDAVERPIATVVLLLARSAGLPLLAIAATAPLLQRWLATTPHPAAKDPFFLYAASNLGSLIALVAYPFAIEPALRLVTQRWAWSGAYAGLLALTAVCAWHVRRAVPARTGSETPSSVEPQATERTTVTWWQRGRWLLLAFVPSSLMLGVTTYISTDVAAVPLLWVATLGLYLLTYVLAFARRQGMPVRWASGLLAFAVAGVLFCMAPDVDVNLVAALPVHLAALFLAAFVCHAQLANERPLAVSLTEYYLWISLGGLMGGVFNTLVAPAVFTETIEYPLALVLAAFLRPSAPAVRPRARWRLAADLAVPLAVVFVALNVPSSLKVPFTSLAVGGPAFAAAAPIAVALAFSSSSLRFGIAVAAVLAAPMLGRASSGSRVLHVERTFFGVLRVVQKGDVHELIHGTTAHGAQFTRPENRCEPLTYYARTGPVGQLFTSFVGEYTKLNVAGIGLGAATIAAYAQPYQQWTFFEINPAVERIARNPTYFTYLSDCAQRHRVVIGDARMQLGFQPDGRFDLMVFDAFSSDTIPLHLVTREALALYLSKLEPRGVMAFHISNRYLDLSPFLGDLARDARLSALLRDDGRPSEEELAAGKVPSTWMIMARYPADFGFLQGDPRWVPAPVSGRPVWTDDYASVLPALKILRR